MALNPDDRSLLSDLLAPPDGYSFDAGVATTFSLDLVALLTAPLGLAAADHGGDLRRLDPVQLLESVRRYSGRIVTYVQGGMIAVPARYRPILTFLEDQIVTVKAPKRGGLFHPKLWALRYRNPDGARLHRCLILSRNLTFDRSWDSVVRLEETTDGTVNPKPVVDLLRRLPALATGGRDPHADAVEDLAGTLGSVRFSVPEGYRSLKLDVWGLGRKVRAEDPVARALIISPFLDQKSLDFASTWAYWKDPVRVVSRIETLDQLDIPSGIEAYVLSDFMADELPTDEPDAGAGQGAELDSFAGSSLSGLHAKFVVSERDFSASVQLGSANYTMAARTSNVELVATLEGKKGEIGIDSIWGDDRRAGLRNLVIPYAKADMTSDADDSAHHLLERWHADLAGFELRLTVREDADDDFSISGVWDVPNAPEGVRTAIAPLSKPGSQLSLGSLLEWKHLPLSRVTPFMILTSRLGKAELETLIIATLEGAPDRKSAVYDEMLSDPTALVRFLALLLAEPDDPLAAFLEAGFGETPSTTTGTSWGDAPVVLFEPLMRAAAAGSPALKRFVEGVSDIIASGKADLLPLEVQALHSLARQLIDDTVGEAR